MKLPYEMRESADQTSKEEAWSITDFPEILDLAASNSLACIGGQFQFRGPIGIAEMYWLNADSTPQLPSENWDDYVTRANSEVRLSFTKIIDDTDFDLEASRWDHIRTAIAEGTITDPKEYLVFVAYFNQNPEKAEQGA